MLTRLRARLLRGLPVLLAIVAAACAGDLPTAATTAASIEEPIGPAEPLSARIKDDDDEDLDLLRQVPNVGLFPCASPDFGSVTRRIGPWGGRIDVGPHTLFVPPGALRRPVDITATAPAAPVVRVTFKPHGLKFRTSATLILSYKHCGAVGPRRPKIAYIDEIDSSILQLLRTKHHWHRQSVSASLRHFSGYAIAD
jgi:hypothetical protein